MLGTIGRRLFGAAAVLALSACDLDEPPSEDDPEYGARSVVEKTASASADSLTRCHEGLEPPDVTCTGCDALGLVRAGPELPSAPYRIVFVPIGHTDDDLPAFAESVERLASELRDDHHGIVGRRKDLFAFFRATRAIRSADGSWPCIEHEEASGIDRIHVPWDITSALMDQMSGRTVIIEVTNRVGRSARANADEGRELGPEGVTSVRIAKNDDARVVDHELGHAIVGLGDEYTDPGLTGCHPGLIADLPPGAPQPWPNLSPHADGRDWDGLVSGGQPGGGTYYDSCVYHPTSSCRMLDHHHDRYCKVCQRAIDRALARANGDEPPTPAKCVTTTTRDEKAIHVRVVSWTHFPPLQATVRYEDDRGEHVDWLAARAAPNLLDERFDVPLDGLKILSVECEDKSGLKAAAEYLVAPELTTSSP